MEYSAIMPPATKRLLMEGKDLCVLTSEEDSVHQSLGRKSLRNSGEIRVFPELDFLLPALSDDSLLLMVVLLQYQVVADTASKNPAGSG